MLSEPVPDLRCATPEDAAPIRALVRAAYATWVPLIGREPLPMGADYERAVREHRFDLLCRGDELLGLIETVLRPDHLWIENVAIRPDCQGKGLGRRLLALAERLAEEAGLAQLRLQTNAAFEINIALYQRVGYRIDRREPFLAGVSVQMSKRLRVDSV